MENGALTCVLRNDQEWFLLNYSYSSLTSVYGAFWKSGSLPAAETQRWKTSTASLKTHSDIRNMQPEILLSASPTTCEIKMTDGPSTMPS